MHDSTNWLDPFGLKSCTPTKNNFTSEGVQHVKDKHLRNKPGWEHKSKWTVTGGDWRSKAKDTMRKADRVSQDGTRHVFEKEYKTPVGIDRDGKPLYKVRVVTEANGDLVTTFPQADWR